tara:strand:+ start:421 stop:624 length:204 start_codon:yes stop_codon:yes gene_type:complete
MRNNPDDISNQILTEIERYINIEIQDSKAFKRVPPDGSAYDFTQQGRWECASFLKKTIKKLKKELNQ